MQDSRGIEASLAAQIGKRLAEVRTELALSQKEFAAALGTSIASYQKYEYGERELPISIAARLYVEHKVNPAWLLQGPDAGPREILSLDELAALLDQLYEAWEKPIAESGVPVSYFERRAGWRMLVREVLQTGRIPTSVITYTHKQLLD